MGYPEFKDYLCRGRSQVSLFTPLKETLSAYLPSDQVETIFQAYQLANKAHQSQNRSSGEAYIHHPLAVAEILADMHMDMQTIIGALLHDVLEDTTNITKKEISKKFGETVADIVDGVTKLSLIEFESRAEFQAESFRKMMIAMAHDIRVILVKLADRLHNMRTLKHLPPEKQERIAKETIDIYAPIANRLGMNRFRIEFEEQSFQILHPLRYRVMQEALDKARGHRKEIMSLIENKIRDAMNQSGVQDFQLFGREKHLYGIYRKMRDKHLQFSEVMDIYAFRIVVNKVDECYRALGVVHGCYKPFPKHFKDYIAIPKANNYQSLHTVLFGPYGVPVEIQMRTHEMDKMAENGIAAHWLYKSDSSVIDKAKMRAREWIKGLLEIQQSAGNSLEFIENVKIDLYPDEVYVFTPKGDIIELPNGATTVDFAYAVHSDVGNSCIAAKVDRRLAPLSSRLKNGQTVKVMTAPGATPDPTWLNFVVTGKARGRIKHFLKHQQRAESIVLGKRMLNKSLKELNTTLDNITEENIAIALQESKSSTIEDLCEAIGLGNQLSEIVARRLCRIDELQEMLDQQKPEPLYIKGTEGVVVHFAKCCRPIPGDPIQGILAAGQGIVIHHGDCRHLQDSQYSQDKIIAVRWEENVVGEFEAELHAEVKDARGVYAGLALAAAEAGANITNLNLVERGNEYSHIHMIVAVTDRKQLVNVMHNIAQLSFVGKIDRYHNG